MHEITTNLTRNKANKTLMGIHNLTTYWDFCMLKTNFWFLKFFLKECVLLKQKKKKKTLWGAILTIDRAKGENCLPTFQKIL